jgi:GNAT superfamily N-acetyltransferase
MAALSGYDPKKKKLGHFLAALDGVLVGAGWSDAHRRLLQMRLAPVAACMSDTPDDCWVVEYVAAVPAARGKGVASPLLGEILERGRSLGHGQAQISFLLGNTPAQRCYERAGFVLTDEKRHPDFEAVFGRPGTGRLLRDL